MRTHRTAAHSAVAAFSFRYKASLHFPFVHMFAGPQVEDLTGDQPPLAKRIKLVVSANAVAAWQAKFPWFAPSDKRSEAGHPIGACTICKQYNPSGSAVKFIGGEKVVQDQNELKGHEESKCHLDGGGAACAGTLVTCIVLRCHGIMMRGHDASKRGTLLPQPGRFCDKPGRSGCSGALRTVLAACCS